MGALVKGEAADVVNLLFCVVGIYAAYLTQGVLQEKLSTRHYAPDNKRFSEVVFINFAQSLACFAWAGLYLLVTGGLRSAAAPSLKYWRVGISNTIGPALGVIALKNISYTAQVLAKSCKTIPVMLAGVLLHGKRYRPLEYLSAILIAAGISMFAIVKDSEHVRSKLMHPHPGLGYTLVFLNLALDGYTNAQQDQIKERYPKTSSWHMMCHVNMWCSLYFFFYAFLFSESGWEATRFLMEHRDAAVDIAVFCLCGIVGQCFIFHSIATNGSVTNTTITTTRKFFNILLSVVWNGSHLVLGQWGGVTLVFGGIGMQIWVKHQAHKKRAAAGKHAPHNGHAKAH